MNKQIKQLTIMGIILALLAGFLIIVRKTDVFKEKEEGSITYTLIAVNTADVEGISYTANGEEVRLNKNDDVWTVAGDDSVDLDEDLVNSMITAASTITSDTVIESPEDLSEYGLSEPQNTITLYLTDGSTKSYSIGAKESMSSKYYANYDGDNNVYVIATKYLTNVAKTIEDITYVPEETEGTEE